MSSQDDNQNQRRHPHTFESVDPVRRVGILRRAAIRWRYRHLTDRELWDLQVGFDTIIEANAWDLAPNFDDLNDRYQP